MSKVRYGRAEECYFKRLGSNLDPTRDSNHLVSSAASAVMCTTSSQYCVLRLKYEVVLFSGKSSFAPKLVNGHHANHPARRHELSLKILTQPQVEGIGNETSKPVQHDLSCRLPTLLVRVCSFNSARPCYAKTDGAIKL